MRSRVAWVWFIGGLMGIAALLVSTASADSDGENLTFLPIASHAAPFDSNPPLDVYLGLVNATLDGDADYYTVRADGSDLTPITDNDRDDAGGLWSPDGAWLAYYNEAGTHLTNLQTGEVRDIGTTVYTEGAWSPNGHYLWWRERESSTVYLYNLSLDITTTLTASAEVIQSPRWSSDSQYLAYASLDTLWVVAAAGPTTHFISADERVLMEWSPTSPVLAFTVGPQEGETVHLWDAATKTLTTIAEDYSLVGWFNHGQQLLLGHDNVLYRANPDGTDITVMYSDVNVNSVWIAPTTTRLLVEANPNYLILDSGVSEGREVENICLADCSDSYFWSPDGRYLLAKYEIIHRTGSEYFTRVIDAEASPPTVRHQFAGYGFDLPAFLPFSKRYFAMADLMDVETGTITVVPLPEGVRPPVDWRYLP